MLPFEVSSNVISHLIITVQCKEMKCVNNGTAVTESKSSCIKDTRIFKDMFSEGTFSCSVERKI